MRYTLDDREVDEATFRSAMRDDFGGSGSVTHYPHDFRGHTSWKAEMTDAEMARERNRPDQTALWLAIAVAVMGLSVVIGGLAQLAGG